MPRGFYERISSIYNKLSRKTPIRFFLSIDHMLSNSQTVICQMANLETDKRERVRILRNGTQA
jgi:hypothetical protein